MKVCNLSSGSEGNVTYIETRTTKILVDAGLSCKEIETRLGYLNVNPDDITAILVSHEHLDHIRGIDVFASKHNVSVFVHKKGFPALYNKMKKQHNYFAFEDNMFEIGDLKILPVEVPHDVERCTGYVIEQNDKKVSIFTDLGHTTTDILKNLYNSNLVFLEANHDPDKLKANPNYPPFLKSRILGNNGHLSNLACANAIKDLCQHGCKQFVLAHLSPDNNSPEFAYDFITAKLCDEGIVEGKHIRIDVATNVPKAIFNL